MNKFRKYSASILLIFAFFAINGAEFLHHHEHCEGTPKQSKCEACIFNNSLHQVVVECLRPFTPVFEAEFTIRLFSTPIGQNYSFQDLNSRAPPAA